jgi:hypothetical protein
MLAKLLTLLTASKAATVATVVVLGAATVTVGAQSPVVQDAVQQAVHAVTGQGAGGDQARARGGDCDRGQPVVVAQRNAADKLLRAAFQEDQKALESLRGKGVDNKNAGEIIKTADEKLKDTLDKALDKVGAQTIGRDGQNKPSGSPSAKPSASPTPSGSPCPSESPKPSGSPVAKTSESPKPSGSAKPSEEGRVTVADRTTLEPALKTIVDQATADMAAIVKDAEAKVGALPSAEHGKPSDKPDNGNKPSDKPGEGNRPSESPKR